ncbi:hypothetical protein OHI65_14800 [Brucella sp. MAB-22]|uniref:hypothetical protein n=1 Tax=Brucella sp. MAB-22 TaxID=2986424 RepID=UPI00221F5B40|nr:hypothetical protein [Brucella sp. MAB-22]UYT57737.1 hypothetical protein OHI65_14800 [Brucella sp. MAB-22]
MVRIEGREADAASATTTTHAVAAAGQRWAKRRYKLRTAATAAPSDEVERHNLRFGLRELIAYHAMREQALARLNRFLTGLQVFLGTSAIAVMTNTVAINPAWLVVASALAGVVLLVVDPAGGARDHRALRSRYHNLLADVEECDGSAEELRSLRAKKERATADSPPSYRGVQAIAFNAAVNATYSEAEASGYRYAVGFWRRVFANWFPMRGFKFEMENPK